MRIAMLSVHSSPIGALGTRDTGGMSIYIRELCRHLAPLGVAVDIFTRLEDPNDAEVVQLSPSIRLVRVPAGPPAPMDKHRQVEIIPAFVQGVDRFQRRLQTPYTLIHSHYWLSGLAGLGLRALWQVPLALTFHTLGELKRRWPEAAHEPPERLAAESLLARTADRVFALTDLERCELEGLYGTAQRRVEVIPGGVDLAHFRLEDRGQARRDLALPEGSDISLAVGRLVPIKGFPLLVEAFARRVSQRGEALLIIAGGGKDTPAAERLQSAARRWGVSDKLRLVGRVQHLDLPRWYNAADQVVVPSYQESFGLVPLEALASGTPVIGARTGGMPDYINDGTNGLLFEPGHADELGARLAAAPALRATPRVDLRASVAHYTWQSAAQRLMDAYTAAMKDTYTATSVQGATP